MKAEGTRHAAKDSSCSLPLAADTSLTAGINEGSQPLRAQSPPPPNTPLQSDTVAAVAATLASSLAARSARTAADAATAVATAVAATVVAAFRLTLPPSRPPSQPPSPPLLPPPPSTSQSLNLQLPQAPPRWRQLPSPPAQLAPPPRPRRPCRRRRRRLRQLASGVGRGARPPPTRPARRPLAQKRGKLVRSRSAQLARAATLCQHTCEMLESYAVVST